MEALQRDPSLQSEHDRLVKRWRGLQDRQHAAEEQLAELAGKVHVHDYSGSDYEQALLARLREAQERRIVVPATLDNPGYVEHRAASPAEVAQRRQQIRRLMELVDAIDHIKKQKAVLEERLQDLAIDGIGKGAPRAPELAQELLRLDTERAKLLENPHTSALRSRMADLLDRLRHTGIDISDAQVDGDPDTLRAVLDAHRAEAAARTDSTGVDTGRLLEELQDAADTLWTDPGVLRGRLEELLSRLRHTGIDISEAQVHGNADTLREALDEHRKQADLRTDGTKADVQSLLDELSRTADALRPGHSVLRARLEDLLDRLRHTGIDISDAQVHGDADTLREVLDGHRAAAAARTDGAGEHALRMLDELNRTAYALRPLENALGRLDDEAARLTGRWDRAVSDMDLTKTTDRVIVLDGHSPEPGAEGPVAPPRVIVLGSRLDSAGSRAEFDDALRRAIETDSRVARAMLADPHIEYWQMISGPAKVHAEPLDGPGRADRRYYDGGPARGNAGVRLGEWRDSAGKWHRIDPGKSAWRRSDDTNTPDAYREGDPDWWGGLAHYINTLDLPFVDIPKGKIAEDLLPFNAMLVGPGQSFFTDGIPEEDLYTPPIAHQFSEFWFGQRQIRNLVMALKHPLVKEYIHNHPAIGDWIKERPWLLRKAPFSTILAGYNWHRGAQWDEQPVFPNRHYAENSVGPQREELPAGVQHLYEQLRSLSPEEFRHEMRARAARTVVEKFQSDLVRVYLSGDPDLVGALHHHIEAAVEEFGPAFRVGDPVVVRETLTDLQRILTGYQSGGWAPRELLNRIVETLTPHMNSDFVGGDPISDQWRLLSWTDRNYEMFRADPHLADKIKAGLQQHARNERVLAARTVVARIRQELIADVSAAERAHPEFEQRLRERVDALVTGLRDADFRNLKYRNIKVIGDLTVPADDGLSRFERIFSSAHTTKVAERDDTLVAVHERLTGQKLAKGAVLTVDEARTALEYLLIGDHTGPEYAASLRERISSYLSGRRDEHLHELTEEQLRALGAGTVAEHGDQMFGEWAEAGAVRFKRISDAFATEDPEAIRATVEAVYRRLVSEGQTGKITDPVINRIAEGIADDMRDDYVRQDDVAPIAKPPSLDLTREKIQMVIDHLMINEHYVHDHLDPDGRLIRRRMDQLVDVAEAINRLITVEPLGDTVLPRLRHPRTSDVILLHDALAEAVYAKANPFRTWYDANASAAADGYDWDSVRPPLTGWRAAIGYRSDLAELMESLRATERLERASVVLDGAARDLGLDPQEVLDALSHDPVQDFLNTLREQQNGRAGLDRVDALRAAIEEHRSAEVAQGRHDNERARMAGRAMDDAARDAGVQPDEVRAAVGRNALQEYMDSLRGQHPDPAGAARVKALEDAIHERNEAVARVAHAARGAETPSRLHTGLDPIETFLPGDRSRLALPAAEARVVQASEAMDAAAEAVGLADPVAAIGEGKAYFDDMRARQADAQGRARVDAFEQTVHEFYSATDDLTRVKGGIDRAELTAAGRAALTRAPLEQVLEPYRRALQEAQDVRAAQQGNFDRQHSLVREATARRDEAGANLGLDAKTLAGLTKRKRVDALVEELQRQADSGVPDTPVGAAIQRFADTARKVVGLRRDLMRTQRQLDQAQTNTQDREREFEEAQHRLDVRQRGAQATDTRTTIQRRERAAAAARAELLPGLRRQIRELTEQAQRLGDADPAAAALAYQQARGALRELQDQLESELARHRALLTGATTACEEAAGALGMDLTILDGLTDEDHIRALADRLRADPPPRPAHEPVDAFHRRVGSLATAAGAHLRTQREVTRLEQELVRAREQALELAALHAELGARIVEAGNNRSSLLSGIDAQPELHPAEQLPALPPGSGVITAPQPGPNSPGNGGKTKAASEGAEAGTGSATATATASKTAGTSHQPPTTATADPSGAVPRTQSRPASGWTAGAPRPYTPATRTPQFDALITQIRDLNNQLSALSAEARDLALPLGVQPDEQLDEYQLAERVQAIRDELSARYSELELRNATGAQLISYFDALEAARAEIAAAAPHISAVLAKLAEYHTALRNSGSLRSDAATLMALDVIASEHGTPLRGNDLVAWLPGDPRRLLVVSPSWEPEHLLGRDLRNSLAAQGVAVVYRQTQVDRDGLITVTDLQPPPESPGPQQPPTVFKGENNGTGQDDMPLESTEPGPNTPTTTPDARAAASRTHTTPSGTADRDARPEGSRTKVPKSDSPDMLTFRFNKFQQNRAAELLARAGYRVEQIPPAAGMAPPVYRIEGRPFGHFAPQTGHPGNILERMVRQARNGTDRIVISMGETAVTPAELAALLNRVRPAEITEVIAVDSHENIVHLYARETPESRWDARNYRTVAELTAAFTARHPMQVDGLDASDLPLDNVREYLQALHDQLTKYPYLYLSRIDIADIRRPARVQAAVTADSTDGPVYSKRITIGRRLAADDSLPPGRIYRLTLTAIGEALIHAGRWRAEALALPVLRQHYRSLGGTPEDEQQFNRWLRQELGSAAIDERGGFKVRSALISSFRDAENDPRATPVQLLLRDIMVGQAQRWHDRAPDQLPAPTAEEAANIAICVEIGAQLQRDLGIATFGFDLPGLDVDTVREYVTTVRALLELHPEITLESIGIGPLPENATGIATLWLDDENRPRTSLILPERDAINPAEFRRTFGLAVDSKYRVGFPRYPVASAIAHEMAHALYFATEVVSTDEALAADHEEAMRELLAKYHSLPSAAGRPVDPEEFQAWLDEQFSGYSHYPDGTINFPEAYAESGASIFLHEDRATDGERVLYERMARLAREASERRRNEAPRTGNRPPRTYPGQFAPDPGAHSTATDPFANLGTAAEVGKALAARRGVRVTGFGPGVDVEIAREYARAVDKVLAANPDIGVREIQIELLDDGVFTAVETETVGDRTLTREIAMNLRYATDLARFHREWSTSDIGTSIAGLADRPAYGSALYELGWALDDAGGNTAQRWAMSALVAHYRDQHGGTVELDAFTAWLAQQFSPYSFGRNGSFWTAGAVPEAFAAVVCDRANATEGQRVLHHLVVRQADPHTYLEPDVGDEFFTESTISDEWSNLSTPGAVAAALAQRFNLLEADLDRPGVSVETAREFARAVQRLLTEHPEIDIQRVRIARLKDDQFAEAAYADALITLNEDFATNPLQFQHDSALSVRSGWFHGTVDRPVYDAIIHEGGHLFDAAGNFEARLEATMNVALYAMAHPGTDLKDILAEQISGYGIDKNDGMLHPPEALAEAFAAVMHYGRANVTEITGLIYDLMAAAVARA